MTITTVLHSRAAPSLFSIFQFFQRTCDFWNVETIWVGMVVQRRGQRCQYKTHAATLVGLHVDDVAHAFNNCHSQFVVTVRMRLSL